LLLDEPTNDLDINSLEVLENSMMEFSGALVLVTHDRYLLDRVSQRILALDGKGHAHYYADLAQWEEHQTEPELSSVPTHKETPAPQPHKSGLSKSDLKELKTLEANMRGAEGEIKKAREAIEDPAIASNAAELTARHQALGAAERKLEALLERWEALEARR